jgi:primary-amine oxidase
VSITLREPIKSALSAYEAATGDAPLPPRVAEAILITPETGLAYVVLVTLPASAEEDAVAECTQLPPGTQPLFTPDDCILAEDIVKADAGVQVCKITSHLHFAAAVNS